jgi:threonine/homoserine/homoserine lactone efflux protein
MGRRWYGAAGAGTIAFVPSPSTIAVFCAAALSLLVLPGPAVLYIVTRSVDQGRRAGLVSVLGIHTGSVVHVAAAAVGLSALLATSAAAFTAVKLAGAAYLVVMGVRQLRSRTHDVDSAAVAPVRSLRRVYGQGVVVNVLNPKTALFFLAFLPQFVDAGRGPAWLQIVVLGLVFIALGMCSDGTYVLVAGALSRRLRENPTFARLRDRVAGSIFVTLGVVAARARRAAA